MQPKETGMSAKEQETEAKRTAPGASATGKPPVGAERRPMVQREKADADDITIGDEAQKLRDKRQRQEKAEGDRR
jgi:hypothetical protein